MEKTTGFNKIETPYITEIPFPLHGRSYSFKNFTCVIPYHKNLLSVKSPRRYVCSLLTFTEISHKYKLPSKVCVEWLQRWSFFQEACYRCHLRLHPFTFSCNTVAYIFQHWMVRNKNKLKQCVLPSPWAAQKEVGGYSQSVMVPLSHFLLSLFLYSRVHHLQELHSLRETPSLHQHWTSQAAASCRAYPPAVWGPPGVIVWIPAPLWSLPWIAEESLSSAWSTSSFSNLSGCRIASHTSLPFTAVQEIFTIFWIRSPSDTSDSSNKLSCVLQGVNFGVRWNCLCPTQDRSCILFTEATPAVPTTTKTLSLTSSTRSYMINYIYCK